MEKKKEFEKEEKLKEKAEDSEKEEKTGFPEDVDFKKFLGCGG